MGAFWNKLKSKDWSKGKLAMYDYIFAGFYEGENTIEPDEKLGLDTLDVGFNSVCSESYAMKYYIIKKFPAWLEDGIIDEIRRVTRAPGVKVDIYTYADPHTINWDSDQMRNKQNRWSRSTKENISTDVFDSQEKKGTVEKKLGIRRSWEYLQKADTRQGRQVCKVSVMIQFSGLRGSKGKYLHNMDYAVKRLKDYCSTTGMRVDPIRINLVDWLQSLYPFSLKRIKEVQTKIPKQTMTDDLLARLTTYKQGSIGSRGIVMGVDVDTGKIVLKDVKSNEDNAENWVISGATGSGKSMFGKDKLYWALGLNIPSMVVDFEGDEYTNAYYYVKAGNPKGAVRVDLSAGRGQYYEPLIIPKLTGCPEIDDSLKRDAMATTTQMLTVLLYRRASYELSTWESSILSAAIKEVYDRGLITEDKSTWWRSSKLRLHMVYDVISEFVDTQIFKEEITQFAKHRVCIEMREKLRIFFEPGQEKYGTFEEPISMDGLLEAQLVIFSFGEKGKDVQQIDGTMLQLKQLSVAHITNHISNYCKYVLHTISLKIIEEYQRYIKVPGSDSIVCNMITGGRKRGDMIYLITNDLGALLGDDPVSATIRQNITTWIVGAIKDTTIIEKFCKLIKQMDLVKPLMRIAEANKTGTDGKREADNEVIKKMAGNRYYKAFCMFMTDSSEKAIVRVELPKDVLDTKIFTTKRGKG